MRPLPSFVQLEPVGQCNLRCKMCAVQFRQDGPPLGPPAFMPFEDFRQMIDRMTGVDHLHLQGLGEPMMHPRFFDMVAYAGKKGLRVTTNTNLTLLTPEKVSRCLESGLNALFASIDGATPATYEKIRVGSNFERITHNLQNLTKTRKARGLTQPEITIVMVLMRCNLEELVPLVRLSHSLGADAVSVQRLCHDFGESSLPQQYAPMKDFINEQLLTDLDADRLDVVFSEARSVAADAGLSLRLPSVRTRPPPEKGRARCDWPSTGAYVSYDKKAMPCCMVGTPDRLNFGEVPDGDLKSVWNNDAYESFRQRLASDDPPEICRTCAVYRGVF